GGMKKIILGFLLLCPGAAQAAEPAGAAPGPSGSAAELQTIVVKPGDTLWSISNTYLKDPKKWNVILKYNRLPSSDPSIALPGMALRVPTTLLKEEFRAAKLVYSLNEVLFRRTGVTDWQGVNTKMDLFKNDTLRTMAAARADVKFYTGEILNLFPNSIAVLRPPGKKNFDVELLAGELRSVKSRVITASARITPKTKDTEFGAKLKDDLTTLVQVTRGKVDVEAQGKTVEVLEGFASEIKMDMPPSQPVKLPPLPQFEQGSATTLTASGKAQFNNDGGIVSLANLKPMGKTAGPAVNLPKGELPKDIPAADISGKGIDTSEIVKMLSVGNPVQSYHLQVSKDQAFTTTVLNKEYDAFDKIDLNELLPPGNYFMRIALVDLLGFEGKFSAPRPLKVGGGQ
ncbi:MAG: LysM peptidoglycan-binding domain-containing protein, partial [Elusimicrobiota bacterium]|nr:LysM peptidoglycan-binding domain-containing protein [Elusimicrobiota bacterium]